jgi:phosphoribosyl 1,2-cyclic phosphate phosphodiesterase
VTLRITILGCGSSGGVPRVGGDWGACDPHEPKNRRTRCGLLLERWKGAPEEGEATTVLIDTSPDLREQLLSARVQRIDAIVYSHDHADQTHGLDDVRAIAIRMRRRIPAYLDAPTRSTLERRFRYIFHGEGGYPAIQTIVGEIAPGVPLTLDGPGGPLTLTPLLQDHGGGPSLGFRCGRFAYSNDVAVLPRETLDALDGLDLWIVDALRYAPHPTHAHVERTLGWIDALKPRRSVLTNLHVDLDYATLKRELPRGVEPAHDGWRYDMAEDRLT